MDVLDLAFFENLENFLVDEAQEALIRSPITCSEAQQTLDLQQKQSGSSFAGLVVCTFSALYTINLRLLMQAKCLEWWCNTAF